MKHYGDKIDVSLDPSQRAYRLTITNALTGESVAVLLPRQGLFSSSSKELTESDAQSIAREIARVLRELAD